MWMSEYFKETLINQTTTYNTGEVYDVVAKAELPKRLSHDKIEEHPSRFHDITVCWWSRFRQWYPPEVASALIQHVGSFQFNGEIFDEL